MPVALQDSRTAQNLMRAFAGESQARNRYTFAAELCRNQNLHILYRQSGKRTRRDFLSAFIGFKRAKNQYTSRLSDCDYG